MSCRTALCSVLLGIGLHTTVFGDIINVPGDQPTIQAAIDAAVDGDEIVVAPGTYFETVNLLGKAVNLRSSEGPEVTTIDADDSGTVVACISGEGPQTIIDGFTITGGMSYIGGGGMDILNSSPTVIRCIFEYNLASSGGGMYNESGSPTVTDCTFSGNEAGKYGGGMANESGSPTVTNCTFSGNMSYHWGGGMSNLEGSNPTVTNCTFSGNSAFVDGGGMYNASSSPTVTNCILWNNSYAQIEDGFEASTTVRYSDVQYGWPGEGNIDADPLFVDPDKGDYHLLPGTPCIDAGDNTAVPSGIVTDLDGNPRFVDVTCVDDSGNGTAPIVDMGPYEAQFDSTDCNDNGEPDICDIIEGISGDCNANAQPDECETNEDCNENGVQDICDVAEGSSLDCNGNAIPDECESGFVYVDDDAPSDPGPGDPSVSDPDEDGSADHPYDALQEAIDASLCWDVVLVAPGTYYEMINFQGKVITVRSSDGPKVTIIDAQEAGTVVTCDSGEGPDTVLEGFTITGGNANGGGGMHNRYSSPTVINCTFTGNTAGSGGGMINFPGSSPAVTNCVFVGNTADTGGGMWNKFDSSPRVTNCIFRENMATYSGGGMYNATRSHSTVINCTFTSNSAGSGAGMYQSNSDPVISQCIFSGNSADDVGGGMFTSYGSDPTVTNCTFYGNSANNGGALYTDNDFTPNPNVANCILWGNSPNEIVHIDDGETMVSFSDVQGGWPGEGNIDADPLFVNAASGDLHLSTDSPCIDAGDNAAVPADTADLDEDGDTDEPIPVDLDGNPRIVDGDGNDTAVVDMGAYEFQGSPCPADFNGDETVGAEDLSQLLGSWGPCPGCPADLNGDGEVGAFDLALLLGAWGPCPYPG